MARRNAKKTAGPLTTAQRLGSLVKSARDILRKDKGLNGDLDRLPMLTWVLFLKFLDDHEQVREERAKMKREKYRFAIEARTAGAIGRPRKNASAATPSSTTSTTTRPFGPMDRRGPGSSPISVACKAATAT